MPDARPCSHEPVNRCDPLAIRRDARICIANIFVRDLVAAQELRRYACQQDAELRFSHAPIYRDLVILHPLPEQLIVIGIGIPGPPGKIPRRIKEAVGICGPELLVDRGEVSIKRQEITAKTPDVVQIVVAEGIRTCADFVFMAGFHGHQVIRVFPIGHGQAFVEFALHQVIEILQFRLLEIIRSVGERNFVEIAVAESPVLAVEAEVFRQAFLADHAHQGSLQADTPAVGKIGIPDRWLALVVLLDRAGSLDDALIADIGAAIFPVKTRQPFLPGAIFDVIGPDQEPPVLRLEIILVILIPDIF